MTGMTGRCCNAGFAKYLLDPKLEELLYHHGILIYRGLSEADCAALQNNLLHMRRTTLDFQVPL